MNDNMSTNIFYGSNHDDLHFDSSEYGDSLYGAPDPVALDAAAVVARLVRLPAGSVRWRGSKRCLVELVARAAVDLTCPSLTARVSLNDFTLVDFEVT